MKNCAECYWRSTDLNIDTGWCDTMKWKMCRIENEDLFIAKEEVVRIETKGW